VAKFRPIGRDGFFGEGVVDGIDGASGNMLIVKALPGRKA
jgi:hypothetical protein